MKRKKIQARTVHNVIPKEMLSEKQLEDKKVAEYVKKHGKYEVEYKKSDAQIEALEYLTKLGYVKKTKDKIYRVFFNYVAHPYLPHVYPYGDLGINVKTQSNFTHFDFGEEDYKHFFKTAKEFQNEMNSGGHSHITSFNFGINFSYQTDVYEVKNEFFDAILLGVSMTGVLTGNFSQPFIQTRYKGKETIEKKNWKVLKKFDGKRFLKGSKELKKDVKKLPWKKEVIGIIEGDDKKLYQIATGAGAKKLKKEQKSASKIFPPPKFFGKGLYSYENVIARIFEDSVSEYLRNNGHYTTTTRFTPKYLGKEIDVFGERGSKKNKEIVLCECKFRFDDRAITKDEIEYFLTKSLQIKKNETKKEQISFNFWLVTTTKQIEPEAKKYLKRTNIQFMIAKLPVNWRKQADWEITKLSELYKK